MREHGSDPSVAGQHHDVYIAGALSGLSPEQRAHAYAIYEAMAGCLEMAGFRPYCPHRSPAAPGRPMAPRDVWTLDHSRVGGSRMLIAYVGLPSLGVGAEIEMARQAGVPVVLVVEARSERPISRLILGCPAVTGLISYCDGGDLEVQLLAQVSKYVSPGDVGRDACPGTISTKLT